jgi:PAS domain S-box-containing protein
MKTKMEQFPATNPNPVLSVAVDGTVLYSNVASELLLHEWGVEVGEKLPPYLIDVVNGVTSINALQKIEVKAGNKVYSVAFHPLPEEECVNIYGFDISDQKELEGKLRESEKKYRSIMETTNEGVWVSDATGRTTYANERMAEMLGYSQSEMIGKYGWDFADKEYSAISKQNFENRRHGINETHEFKFIRKDGSLLWALVNSQALADEDGNFTGVLAMFTDITERRRNEEALKKSERRYHLLFDNMLDGYAHCRMLYDDCGHPVDFIYLDTNSAFERLTGLKEVTGKRVTEVIPEIKETHPELFDAYGRVALTGQSERFEIEFKSLGIWLSISVYSTKREHFVAVFDNITERKRAEEALIRERSLLENVMQTTDVMLVFLDPQFNFVWVNSAYAETCHMKPEEIIGMNYFALYPHEENEAIFRKFRDTGNGVFYKDKLFVFPDQPERGVTYWDWSLAPVKDSGGNMMGLVFSLRETTKYKQAEEALYKAYEQIKLQFEEFQKTNEALLESEDRYRELFESGVDGIIITDLAGNILKVNPAYEKMLGYSMEELRHLSYKQLTPARWHESEERIVQEQIFEHGYSDEYEKEYIRKDGSIFPISIRVWLSRDKQGQPRGMLGLIRDITECKQAEEALLESEERFRTMANTIPQLAWIARSDGYIYWYNERWYAYTGTTPEQMEGWGWQSVHDPALLPKVLEQWKASIALGQKFDMEFPLRGADGLYHQFLTRGYPLKDAKGQVIQWFGTNTDITDRKQIEEKLKQSVKQYQTLGDTIPYGVWITDAEGYVTYASDSFLELMDMSMEQVQKFGWMHRLPPEDVQPTTDHWLRCVQTGEDFEREHRFREKDGSYRNVLAIGRPVRNDAGRITEWVGLNLDVT